MNFLKKIIDSGFENGNERLKNKFNEWPVDQNFYGTSPYEPDVWFKRGDKSVSISYCGHQCADSPNYNKALKEIPELSGKYLYISLYEGNKMIYETFTGKIPEESVVNSFIAD